MRAVYCSDVINFEACLSKQFEWSTGAGKCHKAGLCSDALQKDVTSDL